VVAHVGDLENADVSRSEITMDKKKHFLMVQPWNQFEGIDWGNSASNRGSRVP
jgi:hypothetical protein